MTDRKRSPSLAVPTELLDPAQWVVWAVELRGDKRTKVPYRVDGRRASVIDPTTWTTFANAVDALPRFPGVGFVFTAEDPYTGVDLDECVSGGELDPWAMEIVRKLDSYAEYSPSGTGVHIICRGGLPALGRRRGSVEMYDRARFFTVTGAHVIGSRMTIEQRDEAIAELHAEHVARTETPPVLATFAIAPISNLSDDDLLRRMFAASNGRAIAALWEGEISRHQHDKSVADFVLCRYLVYWCAGDPRRIDRLFLRSRLMRQKWDEPRGRTTYGAVTIKRALDTTRGA